MTLNLIYGHNRFPFKWCVKFSMLLDDIWMSLDGQYQGDINLLSHPLWPGIHINLDVWFLHKRSSKLLKNAFTIYSKQNNYYHQLYVGSPYLTCLLVLSMCITPLIPNLVSLFYKHCNVLYYMQLPRLWCWFCSLKAIGYLHWWMYGTVNLLYCGNNSQSV